VVGAARDDHAPPDLRIETTHGLERTLIQGRHDAVRDEVVPMDRIDDVRHEGVGLVAVDLDLDVQVQAALHRVEDLVQRDDPLPRKTRVEVASDVHFVDTEYGSTYLFGKSVRERALSLIEIAHPSFRPRLLEEAKALGYVSAERSLRSEVAYPIEEERELTLRNGMTVLIRPSKASDVEGLQELFYSLTEQDNYSRFFTRLKSLPVSRAQHLCNVNYESEMAFLAVIGEQERERVIGNACYFVDPSENLAEVAYMIHPEWQGTGLGTALQERMAEYGRSKGLRGFTAEILAQNQKMLSLIKKSGCKLSFEMCSEVCEVTALFE